MYGVHCKEKTGGVRGIFFGENDGATGTCRPSKASAPSCSLHIDQCLTAGTNVRKSLALKRPLPLRSSLPSFLLAPPRPITPAYQEPWPIKTYDGDRIEDYYGKKPFSVGG